MNRQDRRREKKTTRTGASAAAKRASTLTDEASRLLDAGDVAKAEETLRRAVKALSTYAAAHNLLGLICYRTGRLKDAGEHMLEAATNDDKEYAYQANCAAIMNLLGRAPDAEAAARRAVLLDPSRAEGHNSLAVALDIQGRADEAIAACEQALKIMPDYVEARINLGNLRFRQGRMTDAIAAYRQAVASSPNHPTARTNLAVALRRSGDLAAAEMECVEAIAINAGSAEAYNTLGLILKDKGELEEALSTFAEAARLAPSMLDARLNLAGTFFSVGQTADAEAAYGAILAAQPKNADALDGLGVVLMATGRTKEAAERFRAALAVRPDYAEAFYNLASSGATLTDGEIVAAKASLARKRPEEETAKLHFALGETFDRKGDRKAAFEHFHAGNEVRRRAFKAVDQPFDADAHDRHVDQIIATFSRKTLEAGAKNAFDDDRPVFVVGMPRSGTTLVEQILAAHPQIHGAGEADVLARLANLVPDYPKGVKSKSVNMAELAEQGLERLTMRAEGAARLVDKTPRGIQHLGLAALLYTKPWVIHCRRDSRDVGLSCYLQNFVSGHAWATDLADIGRYARAEARLWTHWREVLPLKWHEVDYERLVADPEGESRKLVAFLGLEWDGACLRFHESHRPVFTASAAQVRKPVGAGSIGRWRKYADDLTPLVVALGDLVPPDAKR